MIKLICDICKKEVDKRDVCDEDGHATKDAMIDIEILDTYCRDYGGHYLICVDCYNNIRDFINSRHNRWGWPKDPREDEQISLKLAKEVVAKFKGYLDDDMIGRIQYALEKEGEAKNERNFKKSN